MTFADAVPNEPLLGNQTPSIAHTPEGASLVQGDEAIAWLDDVVGLHLFPWQQLVLRQMLAERPDGKWAARLVGLVCPRQNGKNVVLTARQLVGLFILEESLIIHSAHRADTSMEAFRDLRDHIEAVPALKRRLKRVSGTHGQEAIELDNGCRISFRTRTTSGGRGFRANVVIFDEAMELPERSHASILPTVSAQENPQIIYTGSSVDQQTMDNGIVLARIREQGLAGAPNVAYFEWGISEDDFKAAPGCAEDPETWAKVNPSLGLTAMSAEYIVSERPTLGPRAFLVERLGLGDWPRGDGEIDRIIALADWRECADSEGSAMGDPVFAIDAAPDQKWASIAAAQERDDGLPSIEIHERRPGTSWVLDACKPFAGKATFVIDPRGPAAFLIPDLEAAEITLLKVTTEDYVRACAQFAESVGGKAIRFPPPQTELEDAIAGATTRPVGEQWAWSRKNSNVDISPLVAATLALWGLEQVRPGEGIHSLTEIAEQMWREGRGAKPFWL